MFDAFVMLYQSVNMSHKILLTNKLTNTHVTKTDIVANYLMKIMELRDQISPIKEEYMRMS